MVVLLCYCLFLLCLGSTYPLLYMEVHKDIDEDEDLTIIMVSLACVLIGWFVPIFTLTFTM